MSIDAISVINCTSSPTATAFQPEEEEGKKEDEDREFQYFSFVSSTLWFRSLTSELC